MALLTLVCPGVVWEGTLPLTPRVPLGDHLASAPPAWKPWPWGRGWHPGPGARRLQSLSRWCRAFACLESLCRPAFCMWREARGAAALLTPPRPAPRAALRSAEPRRTLAGRCLWSPDEGALASARAACAPHAQGPAFSFSLALLGAAVLRSGGPAPCVWCLCWGAVRCRSVGGKPRRPWPPLGAPASTGRCESGCLQTRVRLCARLSLSLS